MSCDNCDCDDCREERGDCGCESCRGYNSDPYPESDPSPESDPISYVPPPVAEVTPLPPPKPIRVTGPFVPQAKVPATAKQKEEWLGILNDIWESYPGVRVINMPAAIALMMARMDNITPERYSLISEQIRDFLRELNTQTDSMYSIWRGRGGGLMRNATQEAPIPQQASTANNNYTCLACGNPKCDKLTEPSCWKCGTPIPN